MLIVMGMFQELFIGFIPLNTSDWQTIPLIAKLHFGTTAHNKTVFYFTELGHFQRFANERKKNFYKYGLKCNIYSAVHTALDTLDIFPSRLISFVFSIN